MNANELADLFATTDMPSDWGCQAQAMLRNLQADNEKLTADCVSLHAENELYKDTIVECSLECEYKSKKIDELKAENEALKAHPVKDRENDRLRFSDEAFNRWLDESISDSGHTVYDLIGNVCEAWHGWENSQYYTAPKELTDEEITAIWQTDECYQNAQAFTRAILKKAREK